MAEKNDFSPDEGNEYDYPTSGEFVLDDFDVLSASKPKFNWFRLILMVAVVASCIYMTISFSSDLAYFFSNSEPVLLGNAGDYPIKKQNDPNFELDIPSNTYVKIKGIPIRQANSEEFIYFKLRGVDIYVEQTKEEDKTEDSLSHVEYYRESRTRALFVGEGRLISMKQAPKRYEGIRSFHSEEFSTLFCMDLSEEDIKDLESKTSRRPVCHSGYILQAGVAPSDHWWYLLIYAVLIAFTVFTVASFIRYSIQFSSDAS